MCVIQIGQSQLTSRGQKIRQLLRPLVRHPSAPAYKVVARARQYVISAYDGSLSKSDYRELSFPTIVSNLRGRYHERWIQLDNKSWYMERAYLSIYWVERSIPMEKRKFLALHCDPNVSDEASHAIYKQGPHLHIQDAAFPIPRAHIALDRTHLNLVLNSINSLTKTLELAVLMIKEEVLDAMK